MTSTTHDGHGLMLVTTERLTESKLRRLAVERPRELVATICAGIDSPGLRARAAEAAGLIQSDELAVPILLQLLGDHDPVVREGAIYGLERHLTPRVRERLQALLRDPTTSVGLREAARDALDLA